MHESHGELLLGGSRLHNVHVELEQEEPLEGHADWMLSGRFHVTEQEAQELEIPVTPEQIKVHRVGTLGTGTLSIEATYTVRVNLPGYPLDLDFHASTKNKGIY